MNDIDPHKGPKSGGTKVTVYGEYLDAGTSRKVYFGSEDHECVIRR